jgi:hypothetical protein
MLAGLLGPEQQQSGGVGFKDYANRRMPCGPIPVGITPVVLSKVAYKYHGIVFPKLRLVQKCAEFFPGGVTDKKVGGGSFQGYARPF